MMTSSFNPRTPCGVRLPPPASSTAKAPFQSTHSLRSATRYAKDKDLRRSVSIHALLAECDMRLAGFCTCLPGFNPRTPCGVRPPLWRGSSVQPSFNPRTPCGVRRHVIHVSPHPSGFNPRTPCGVRPAYRPANGRTGCFNPRTPCGVRRKHAPKKVSNKKFQSTHSLRSATVHRWERSDRTLVSIHALLAECDDYGVTFTPEEAQFQSTHSLRSATNYRPQEITLEDVSIHALLAECDCLHALMVASGKSFNPRTPCGVRLFGGDELQIVFAVSIHALLV